MKTTNQLQTLNNFLRRVLVLLYSLWITSAGGVIFLFWVISAQYNLAILPALLSIGLFLILSTAIHVFILRYLAKSLARPITHLIANTQLASRPNPKLAEVDTNITEIEILARSINHMLGKVLLREDHILSSEKRLSLALRGSGEGVWDWDMQENTSYIDNNCCSILAISPEEVERDNRIWVRGLHTDDVESAKEYFRRALTGALTAFEQEYRVKKAMGDEPGWIQIRGSVVEWDAQGEPMRMSGTVSDVTQRKNSEQQLKLYSTAFKCTKNAVLMLDQEFCVLAVNRAFCQITGQHERMLVGQKYYFHHQGIPVENFHALLKLQVNNRAEWHGETLGQRVDGSFYPQELAVYGVFDDHVNLTHYVAIFSDITERKRTEDTLRTLANYDPLTGLANRYMFNATLTRSLQSAKRKNEKLALLFIDLDHFKQVNDLLGHEAGDHLLIDVAMRIQGNIRETDTAARLAGDEFVVILENIQALTDVDQVAGKILDALSGCSGNATQDIRRGVSASIGVSIYPDHGDNAEALLRSADRAMYNAKAQGRNRLMFCAEADSREA